MEILIIDDETEYRLVLRDYLVLKGYEVVEARNGEEALNRISNVLPDLIISDLNMPVMNGELLYAKIKESDSAQGIIPFIFLSGNMDDTATIKWLVQGVHYCIRKPVSFEYLAAHIHSIFENTGRINKFVEKQVDKIADAFPDMLLDYFPNGSVSIKSIEDLATFTAKVITQLHSEKEITSSLATDKLHHSSKLHDDADSPAHEYRILRLYAKEYKTRQTLVLAPPIENLSWELIFLVAEAEFSDKKIYVSDLYISFNAAKSTVNERINSLLIDGVFQKNSHPTDRRKLFVSLTDEFKKLLIEHVRGNIDVVRRSLS